MLTEYDERLAEYGVARIMGETRRHASRVSWWWGARKVWGARNSEFDELLNGARAAAQFSDSRGPPSRAQVSIVLSSIVASAWFVSLYIPASLFQSDILYYPACAHSLWAKERALSIPIRLSAFKSKSPFHYIYFFCLTSGLFFSFIHRMISYPMASNVSNPKAFHTLSY